MEKLNSQEYEQGYEIELRKAKGLTPSIPVSESERRLKRCRKLMEEEGFDAVFVYGSPYECFRVRYLANYVGPVNIAEFFLMLSTNGNEVLFIDKPYNLDNAREMSWIKDVRLIPSGGFGWRMEELEKTFKEVLMQGAPENGKIGICIQSMPTKYYLLLKKVLPKVEFKDAAALLSKVIEEKSDYDIRMIKHAAGITDEAMEAALDACKEGVREYEVALLAQSVTLSKGAEYAPATLRTHSFIASGSNNLSNCRNYAYTGKKLMKGDMFLVDLGICYNGYYSDMCRTVCIGQPSARQKEIFDAVASMHNAMFKALKLGISGGEIWDKMLDVARQTKFFENAMNRSWIGHGIGSIKAEPPMIAKGEPRTIKSRSFMNIEPGLHFPGFNAAIGDTTFVTEKGVQFVTKCNRELHIA